MIILKTPLVKMASAQPEKSFFRALFANMARQAGINEDLFARASYIEGLLGARPGSLSRNPRPALQEVVDAFESGEENHLVSMMRTEYKMSDQDISAMIGLRDFDLFGALVRGATKAMPKGSIRGLSPQDIAMSLASGLSPLTLKPFEKYGPGQNVFYWLGRIAKGKISMGGLLAVLSDEAFNRAFDIVRGTNRSETRSRSLETPVGGGDTDAVIGDFLSDESSINNINLVYAIFNDRSVLNVVTREMSSRLSPPGFLVWNAIAEDPSMIEMSNGLVGVNNTALATKISDMTGKENTRSLQVSAGKYFREKVWPVFQDIVGDPKIVGPLLKNQQIQDIIFEATRGITHRANYLGELRRQAFIREASQRLVAQVLKLK